MVLALPDESFAAFDSGDTAWVLASAALVLLMTPGLAFFYGGLSRQKSVLNMMMMSFGALGVVSVIYVLWGYSMSFSSGHTGGSDIAGIFDNPFSLFGLSQLLETREIDGTELSVIGGFGTVPAIVWVGFQLTFAVITVALISGALAERVKFGTWLVFSGLWVTLVYFPLAHMVWGGGLLSDNERGFASWLFGTTEGDDGSVSATVAPIDFAGGTVVHINAGIAGLVACLVLGKRKGFPTTPMAPHNLGYTLMGAAMLWVGWFGFNAGSAVAANGTAGMAMLVTQIATAAAALGWMFAEWITHGKPSALGIASGVVAGLVAITPAAGTVGPMGALVIGLAAGVVCFFCATTLKRKLGYDDSLDAFGVHGIGGILGAILTGVFAAPALGGFGTVTDIGAQVWIQFKGVAFTVVYTAIVTFIILKVLDAVMGLRVTEEEEAVGLDLAQHNERGYNL